METNCQSRTGLFRQEAPIAEDIKPNFQFSEVKDTKVLCAPYTDVQSANPLTWGIHGLFLSCSQMKSEKSKLTYIMLDTTWEVSRNLSFHQKSIQWYTRQGGNSCTKTLSCSCILHFHLSSNTFVFLQLGKKIRTQMISRLRKQLLVNIFCKSLCLSGR